MKIKIRIILIALILICPVYSQYPGLPRILPDAPQPSSFTPGARIGVSPSPPVPPPSVPMPPHHRAEVYDPDEISRRNRANQQIIDEALAYMQERDEAVQLARQLADSGFPSRVGEEGTEYFHSAFEELSRMLSDSIPMNLGRAVFVTENAFLGNTLDYRQFEQTIQKQTDLCQWKLSELKKQQPDDLTRNAVLYSLMTDTLTVRLPGTEKQIVHYPVQYNLDDYKSEKDYTSHFVTTLLSTNRGQCYSMPLLYLILAEKLGAEAHLSFAPRHSLIKIPGHNGGWYNLELTCGYILSDYHYANHNYIKTEAIRSRFYLSPLDRKETIAYMLVQLGRYYLVKFGYSPFVLQCALEAKKYMKAPVDALLLEGAYESRLTLEIARLLKASDPGTLKHLSPEAYKHYEQMHEIYDKIEKLGYEEMPDDVYRRWLEHVEREKEKEKHHPRSPFIQIVK